MNQLTEKCDSSQNFESLTFFTNYMRSMQNGVTTYKTCFSLAGYNNYP